MEQRMNDSGMGRGKKYTTREAIRAMGWALSNSDGAQSRIRRVTLFGMLSALLNLMTPLLIGQAIDLYPHLQEMTRPLLLLVACVAVNAFCENRQGINTARLSQKMVFDLRSALCGHMLHLPIPQAERYRQGDLMSRLTNDTETISQTLSEVLPRLVSSGVTVLGCLIMILRRNQTLALITLGFGLLSLVPTLLTAAPMQRRGQAQQKELGQLNARAAEFLDLRESICAFGGQAFFQDQFDRRSTAFRRAGVRMQILGAALEPLLSMIGTLSFVLCVGVGARAMIAHQLTLGAFQACLVFTRQMIRPLSSLGMIMAQLNGCCASIDRVREISEVNPSAEKHLSGLPSFDEPICWQDVSFSYLRDQTLYDHLNLIFEPGKTTAIVGATGAGKTSILNLLLKFYAPEEGSILIGGTSLTDISSQELYRHVAIVMQDQFMMPGTVAECISYGVPGASMEEIVQAARETGADEFISRLPLGYNEPMLDENQLSGGQWQLIALSGILLSRAELLLLDEATSSIDTCTEQTIQQALQKVQKDRTCVVIAHRLSTIRNADRILLMDHGRILEAGSHQELMAREGAYYRLYTAGEIVD